MKIRPKFKWQDMWVGIFHAKGTRYDGALYLNLLPMFPIEIRWRPTPKSAGFVMPLIDIPEKCPEDDTPLRMQYFKLEGDEHSETGCFLHICLTCGRTWRQGR